MKVLVIGGAGYIGSHVVKQLMACKHEVNILIEADLRKAFSKGFDAFIHLAAFKAAGESMIIPEKYSVNNITGTLNILNVAMEYNCKNMVFSSSAAIFGEPKYIPIDEDHPKNPENYYGYTKLSIEDYMEWYSKCKELVIK